MCGIIGCGNKNNIQPEKIGTFITEPGEYEYSKVGGIVKVYEEGQKLNYRIGHPSSGGSGGPVPPLIEPKGDWFVYLQSNNKAWIYNGVDALYLSLRHANGGGGSYQLSESYISLPILPPAEVTKLLPKQLIGLLSKVNIDKTE